MSRRIKCPDCKQLCGKGKAPVAVVQRLEVLYRKLLKCGPESPLIKYLPRDIFDAIKRKATIYDMNLLDCLQAGFTHYEYVGLYAADPDCYNTFAKLIDMVLQVDYNFKEEDIHPEIDFGDPEKLGNLDPSGTYVMSTRVRCSRALKGYPFNTGLSEEQYLEIETRIEAALLRLTGDLEGTYVRIKDMSDDEIKSMRREHTLFPEITEVLETAKTGECWPEGRGYFTNEKRNFFAWVNEKDHLRMVAMEKGANLGQIFQTMVNALTQLEENLRFARHERYGYLSSSPFSLGTGIKGSVHMNLPKLGKDKPKLFKAAEQNELLLRGIDCNYETVKSGKFDLSTKQAVGLTEIEILQKMVKSVKGMIKAEKEFVLPKTIKEGCLI